MVDPHITDDEQVEKLKSWWKKNGSSVIFGIVLGLGIVAGVNYWQGYAATRAERASALYEKMMIDYAAGNKEESENVGANLIENYAATPYAGKAGLFMAKLSFEKNDISSAKAQLQWTVDNAVETATAHTARLRLGRLLLSEKRYDEVESQIKVKEYEGFQSEYKELEGDLRVAQKRFEDAHTAYQEALAALPEGSNYGDMLVMKLDAVAGGLKQ